MTQFSLGPHGCQTTIILLSNVNTSVFAANGGQPQHKLLIFYNIYTWALIISAQVGGQGFTESAHLPVNFSICTIPRPLRSLKSWLPRKMGPTQIAHPICPHALPCQSRDHRGGNKYTRRQRAQGTVQTRKNQRWQHTHSAEQEGTNPGQNAKRSQQGTQRLNGSPKRSQTRQYNATRTDEALKTGRMAPENTKPDKERQVPLRMTMLMGYVKEKFPI